MRRPLWKLVGVGLLMLVAVRPTPRAPGAVPVPADPVTIIRFEHQHDELYAYVDATTTTTTSTLPPTTTTVQREEGTRGVQAQQVARTVAATGPIVDLILSVFGDAGAQAVHVADCESSLDPNQENGIYKGLFQIGAMHAQDWLEVIGRPFAESWMDPVANVTYAHSLFRRSGWGPWECKP